MKPRFRSLSCVLAITSLALPSTVAAARSVATHALGKKTQEANKEANKKKQASKTLEAKQARPQPSVAVEKRRPAKHARAESKSKRSKDEPASKEAKPALTGDLAAVKDAIDLARKAKTNEATAVGKRSATRRPGNSSNGSSCDIRTPSEFRPLCGVHCRQSGMAEHGVNAAARGGPPVAGRSDAATIRRFTGDRPTSAQGAVFALARSLLAEGDRDGAGRWVREAWRSEELSERLETEAFEMFRDLLDARGPPGADGQAHRGQGFFGREARSASASAATSLRS